MSKKMANIKKFKFKDYNIVAEADGGVYAFLAKYKGRNIVYKSTDATLYLDIDANERRSHAAKAYIYEKIKNIYYHNVNSDIVVGATYECIKDVLMVDPRGKVFYEKGCKYRSDQSGCITNKFGQTSHYWPSTEDLNEHFKLLSNG